MSKTTLETIDELLEGALTDTDNSEAHYKLRNARQLLEVVKQRQRELAEEGVTDVVDDDKILSELRDLGYIE